MWSSADREVALKMIFMYARNSQQHFWWDVIRIVVWGPSAQLLANDEELQVYIKEMLATGIEVITCKGCSDKYGVSDTLNGLGVEVLSIGKQFTNMLKSDWKVITL